MSDQPPSPPSSPGSSFCAECGAVMPADARFCGACGAPPPDAPTSAMPAAEPTGASTWQGVAPVVEKPGDGVPPSAAAATAAMPAAAAGGPPPAGGPPAGGPPAGGPPPEAKGRSKGPIIAVVVVLLAVIAGAALLLGGGDDDNADDDGFDRDESAQDADEDEETTTTEADEETTTTTEAEATTTTAVDSGIVFVQALDDTGLLVMQIPDFWTAVDGASLPDGSPNLQASTDLAAFRALSASGVSYTKLPTTADPDQTIDFLAQNNGLNDICSSINERQDYDDQVFVGRAQVFEGCGSAGATVFEIVGTRADGTSVEVTTILIDPDPVEIFEEIRDTFNLTA